jgi:hypothetical protein
MSNSKICQQTSLNQSSCGSTPWNAMRDFTILQINALGAQDA